MIARHWRGWTKPQNADAYETLLKTQVLPGPKKIAGYRGGYVLRGDAGDGVEFVVINLFDSVEAVRAFCRTRLHYRDLRTGSTTAAVAD